MASFKTLPQAVLLCGGKGERLRPLTESLPKPLIPIRGKPILNYLIQHIESFGIRDLLVATGYQAEKIETYFREQHQNLQVKTINSGDVDIIERIKSVAPSIRGDFILFYGDTLSDVNLHALAENHHASGKKVSITLWPFQSQFGMVRMDKAGLVQSFLEKPVLDEWINIGYFYFSAEILPWLNEFTTFVSFLDALVEKKELKGFQHRGKHITVNTIKELEEAENNIESFEK